MAMINLLPVQPWAVSSRGANESIVALHRDPAQRGHRDAVFK
jgi:hypothetical protein